MVCAAISGDSDASGMRVARTNDVGMDFVGYNGQLVANGKSRYLFEFRPAERASSRVLRVAEDQHASARIGNGPVGGETEHQHVPLSRMWLAIRRRPVSLIAAMNGG